MKILVLNCGSSSLKFQLIDIENEEILAKGNFERIGGMKTTLKLDIRGEKSEILRIARDYDEAIAFVLKVLQKPENNLLNSLDEIGGVGHRIVHGGEMFNSSVLIDEEVIMWGRVGRGIPSKWKPLETAESNCKLGQSACWAIKKFRPSASSLCTPWINSLTF